MSKNRWMILFLPILILVILLVTYPLPDNENTDDKIYIDMTTEQFEFSPVEIRVKSGARVVINLTSIDVLHGFGITEYGIYESVAPGETIIIEFTADKQGIYEIYCTDFCGTGHPLHKGLLIVDE